MQTRLTHESRSTGDALLLRHEQVHLLVHPRGGQCAEMQRRGAALCLLQHHTPRAAWLQQSRSCTAAIVSFQESGCKKTPGVLYISRRLI